MQIPVKTLALICLSALSLCACDRSPEPTITSKIMLENARKKAAETQNLTEQGQVLAKYLDAHFGGEHALAYEYISEKDKQVKSKDEYAGGYAVTKSKKSAISSDKIVYHIEGVEVNGDTAKAVAVVTLPNIGLIFADFVEIFSDPDLEMDGAQERFADLLEEKYPNEEYPMATERQQYQLNKEADGWKVFLNLRAMQNKKLMFK